MKRKTWRQRLRRLMQLITGVHQIHHTRFATGYKLPFIGWAYFPPWRVRDRESPTGRSPTYRYGWQRVHREHFHDCTWTGRY